MRSKKILRMNVSAGRERLFSVRDRRSGFTLIEMMVSAALVVLIMSLFAQIFAIATTSIQDQRTISRHDQKVRVLETAIRQDLEALTFRQITGAEGMTRGLLPLHPSYPVDENRQRGYFYYSENDPTNQSDDVLQFTVDLSANRRGARTLDETAPSKFVGRATLLGGSTLVDQPALDDGQPTAARAASRAAEVSYFLRGGNLYRRTLLLRDPPSDRIRRGQASLGTDGSFGPMLGVDRQTATMAAAMRLPANYDATFDPEPVHADFDSDGTVDAGETQSDYFSDFDLSATRYQYIAGNDPVTTDADGDGFSDQSAIYVHTVESLSNVTAERPLGRPWNRFGHFPLCAIDQRAPAGVTFLPAAGQPFEFLRAGAGTPLAGTPLSTQYIGRFHQGETSFSQFVWPGVSAGVNSPLNRVDLSLASDSTIQSASGSTFIGSRFAEDLVLGNVVSFDVKVWDDFAQQFVDLGGGVAGLFGNGTTYSKRLSGTAFGYAYGPRIDGTAATRISFAANNVFDTWHHAVDGMTYVDLNSNGTLEANERNAFDGILDPPPVWPSQNRSNPPLDTTAGNGVAGDAQITGGQNSVADFEGVWDNNQSYQTGDLVRPDLTTRPYSLTATDPSLADMLFVCTVEDTSGDGDFDDAVTDVFASGATQPDWQSAIRYGRVIDDGVVGGDRMVWRPVYTDNRIGLKKLAILITVRDPKTDSLRDITVLHSFVE